MKNVFLTCLLCFVSCFSLSRCELPSSCLSDLVESSAGRCCSPQTFVVIEFTLGFGCDLPSRLDQGVRFEVQEPDQDWEPIRFYTPTLDETDPSVVYLIPGRIVFAEAFRLNSTFPYHYVNATPGYELRVREYLCGEEFSGDGVRLRWMQRYAGPSANDTATWWLDDIRISRWDGVQLTTIMENNFTVDNLGSDDDYVIQSGELGRPECAESANSVLHFRQMSEQDVPRRSLVINDLSLGCDGDTCLLPPATPTPESSECSVTSCVAGTIHCSLPLLSPVECTACPLGYATGNDSYSYNVACSDINECAEPGLNSCNGLARCLNTDGSYLCYCPPGYQLTDDNGCADVDECVATLHNCSHSCVNTEGSFSCSCPEGYLLEDSTTCTVFPIGFAVPSVSVSEGENITVEIILQGSITRPLSVRVETEDLTTSPGDYIPLRQTVTFQPPAAGGNTAAASETVTVSTTRDEFGELTEKFRIVLSQPSLGLNITQGSVIVAIVDSTEVVVEFDPVSYTVTEGEDVMFRIVKRTNTTREVTVFFNAGNESTNVTFAPEESERVIPVSTIDDDVHDTDRTIMAVLEGGEGVRLGSHEATANVKDNDVAVIGFNTSDLVYSVLEGDNVTVTVQLTGKTATEVMVYMATQDGNATAGDDYTTFNSTLNFSSSVSLLNISIQTLPDSEVEGEEEFQLVLSHPVEDEGRVAIDNTSVTIIIIDDDISLPPVTLGFELPDYTIGEESLSLPVCVLVTDGELGAPVQLTITSSDGDAKAGVDYQAVSVSLALAPESPSRICTTITVINDNELEGEEPETFQLSLEAPPTTGNSQIIFTSPNSTRVAIYDDEVLLSRVDDLLSLSSSDASDRLSDLVNSLIESGRKVSPQISEQVLQASQDLLNNIDDSSDMGVGSRVLATLDQFALRAYDETEQPELKLDGLSLRVQEIDSLSSNDSTVVGIDQNGTTITLPMEAFQRAGESVRIASFIYTNLTSSLPTQSQNAEDSVIGSPVISTALGCGSRGNDCPSEVTSGFNVPVRIKLPVNKMNDYNASCQFLNLDDNIWSGSGCSMVEGESTDTVVVCECNHLTHFAILLSPGLNISDSHELALQIIGYVGVSISLVCMVCTVIALVALKSLWGMRNYIHVNLCICLIISQLIFIIGVDKTQNQNACSAIAILLHYFFLVSFMWMLMEGVVLYVALVRVFIKKQSLYIAGFTIVSYGVPLLYMVVTIPLGLVLGDERGNHYGYPEACWLRYDTRFVFAFIVPVILIILTNIGFFFMAVYIMYKHQRRAVHKSVVKKVKHWLKISIALLVVMGITWLIGVVVFTEALLFVAYIFTIFVAFQGTIIFVMFIVLSKQVRENYRKWWRGKVAESDTLSKYFSSSESGGNKSVLGRFSSLRTSSFSLSRHRSTFHSSHVDTDIKIPDEDHEAQRQVISPEMKINEYMMTQKHDLGESVVDSSSVLQTSTQPNGKIDLGTSSVAETTDYFTSEPNGVTVVGPDVGSPETRENGDSHETRGNGDCNHVGVANADQSHVTIDKDPDVSSGHEEVVESSSSQGQDSSDPPDNRHAPSDIQQSEGDLQTVSEEKTAL